MRLSTMNSYKCPGYNNINDRLTECRRTTNDRNPLSAYSAMHCASPGLEVQRNTPNARYGSQMRIML